MKKMILLLAVLPLLFSGCAKEDLGSFVSIQNNLGYNIEDVRYTMIYDYYQGDHFYYDSKKVNSSNLDGNISSGAKKYAYLSSGTAGTKYIYFKVPVPGGKITYRTKSKVQTFENVDLDFVLDSKTEIEPAY